MAVRKRAGARSALASLAWLLLAVGITCDAGAQPPAVASGPTAPVQIERQIVHSAAIAGNLLGTSAERSVFVLLPPGYGTHPRRRYPVVYALHGFGIGPEKWMDELHAQSALEAAFAAGTPEMIFVFPDGGNEYGGSFFVSSMVTGDFEGFIADELPAFVDAHYRTIAKPAARGLMGHSMGGYGTARIGALHPGRFGALYLMSPCCLLPLGVQGLTAKEVGEIAALKSPAAAIGLPFKYAGPLATAAAFSPNPRKPPLFVDLAVDADGKVRDDILAKRAANAPLAFIDQHIAALRTYARIGIDVGNEDSIVSAATMLHKNLDSYAIANVFEVYQGNHTNRVADRFRAVVLPFFGRELPRAAP
ncbi:alpha/beta hydrolase [Sphingomonas sp. MMS24-J13]|uniref:alpha/beta hydrolase n=1 Tax=Sphingomonas sp. MMS24-J13 TaxID=3238686 RepID=UPI00384F27EA